MFRVSAAVLLSFVLVGSFLAPGLCLLPPNPDNTGQSPAQVLKTDEDCTCRMSSADDALASNPQGTAAILPMTDFGVYVPAATLILTSTEESASFDTGTPAPPPKA